ncbi:MAG: TIGR04282 family arsenosugar biosynthesis glycosyltransferase [Gammaproteobacteria bacterium]
MSTALIVFAKAPETSKRRLTAGVGRAAATRTAAALLDDALARGTASGLAPLYLYWNGPASDLHLDKARAMNYRVEAQQGCDLGARMQDAFAQVLVECERALLIGTDCPDLDAVWLADAGERLHSNDVLFAPAKDGGYVAIGLGRTALPHLEMLFTGLDWGEDNVAAQTRKRIASAGLKVCELAPLDDLDDAADLARLAERHPFLAATLQGAKISKI